MIEILHKTKGNLHGVNEDYFCFREIWQGCAVAVLCDGMGGLALGALASKIVGDSVADFIYARHGKMEPERLLIESLVYADEMLRDESHNLHSKMGAAVAICYFQDNCLYYTWQGNVRIYAAIDGKIDCLTDDHVVDIGYGHKRLIRCIKGGGFREDIPTVCISLNTPIVIYMCTDGFYEKLDISTYGVPTEDFNAIVGSDSEDDASVVIIKV